MYLVMAAVGIVLIITGLLTPYRVQDNTYHSAHKSGTETMDQPEGNMFSMELLEQQVDMNNKRINTLTDKLSELENKLNTNIYTYGTDELNDTNKAASDDNLLSEGIPPTFQEEEKGSINDINSIIYNMYDNGSSMDEISSALRIGRGELQLRLGLRKTQRK